MTESRPHEPDYGTVLCEEVRPQDDWFDAAITNPKHLEVVLIENNGYYEVCVYRYGFNGPSSYHTHSGMLVRPSYWRKLPRREQESK